MEVKTIFSEKGKVLLVMNNYKFYQYKELKSTGEQRWRCNEKKCLKSVYTLGSASEPIFSRAEGEHNHQLLSEKILIRHTVSNSVKRKADQGSSEKPAKLIHRELDENSVQILTRKDVKYISNNVSRAKLSKLSKLPKSIIDTQDYLDSAEVKDVMGQNFLLHNDKMQNIVIFSSDSNLKFLTENQHILLGDGTFEFCLKFFLQLFTLHSFCNGFYIPLVFCLLKDKKESTYAEVFRILAEKCRSKGLKKLEPKHLVLDFEISIHLGLRQVFLNVTIIGCRFHLGQAWWRKIQQLGLSREFKDADSIIGKWLRYVFGLKYLDPEEVGDGFMDLVTIQPEDTRLENFTIYLVEIYVGPHARFPPEVWASATADLWWTTNACESFHSRYNVACGSPHPNVVTFLSSLKQAQSSSTITRNSLDEVEVKRKEVLRKQKFISAKLDQYKNGGFGIRLSFLKCISFYASHQPH